MKKTISAFALVLLVSAGQAGIINVPGDSMTIQAGINGAEGGDTVLVQPGLYRENIRIQGTDIILGSLLLTTGDTGYISQTVIDGDFSGPVITFNSVGWIDTAAVSGFTIRNGLSRFGGGICCEYAKPLIFRNRIESNYSDAREDIAYGAAVYCGASDAIIRENEIINNCNLGVTHNYAGGIYCQYSYPLIENNFIADNSSQNVGGGMCLMSSGGTIKNNVICRNRSRYGGAISMGIYAHPTIVFNVMYENEVTGMGDGLDIFEHSFPRIINNVIANNNDHLGIYWDDSSPVIRNTIVWGNTVLGKGGEPQVTYCDIQGGYVGVGNIEIDPFFRDPENGDFRLMAVDCGDAYNSPAIDAGHPDGIDIILDCRWGLGTILADMGAYGGNNDFPTDADDRSEPPVAGLFSLRQNYPNPFNSVTRIGFSLPRAAHVTLEIYNIVGQKVRTLIDREESTGSYSIDWDGTAGNGQPVTSGIYLYRFRAEDHVETRKMLLLK